MRHFSFCEFAYQGRAQRYLGHAGEIFGDQREVLQRLLEFAYRQVNAGTYMTLLRWKKVRWRNFAAIVAEYIGCAAEGVSFAAIFL